MERKRVPLYSSASCAIPYGSIGNALRFDIRPSPHRTMHCCWVSCSQWIHSVRTCVNVRGHVVCPLHTKNNAWKGKTLTEKCRTLRHYVVDMSLRVFSHRLKVALPEQLYFHFRWGDTEVGAEYSGGFKQLTSNPPSLVEFFLTHDTIPVLRRWCSVNWIAGTTSTYSATGVRYARNTQQYPFKVTAFVWPSRQIVLESKECVECAETKLDEETNGPRKRSSENCLCRCSYSVAKVGPGLSVSI